MGRPPEEATWVDEGSIPVYRDGSLSHLRGPNPGTPYTLCGVDAGAMRRYEHPISHAGIWCSACMSLCVSNGDSPTAPKPPDLQGI